MNTHFLEAASHLWDCDAWFHPSPYVTESVSYIFCGIIVKTKLATMGTPMQAGKLFWFCFSLIGNISHYLCLFLFRSLFSISLVWHIVSEKHEWTMQVLFVTRETVFGKAVAKSTENNSLLFTWLELQRVPVVARIYFKLCLDGKHVFPPPTYIFLFRNR